MKFFPPSALFATLFLASSLSPAFSASYTWTPTAAGTTYDWTTTSQNNWGTGVAGLFPDAAGDVANVNNNIAGAQTINLNGSRTIGVLNLGDSDGLSAITIAPGSPGTSTLTFQSAIAGGATAINVGTVGASGNTISSQLALGGSSPLTITTNGLQTLFLSGGVALGNNQLNLVSNNTAASPTSISISGTLSGSGALVKSGIGYTVLSGSSSAYNGAVRIDGGTLSLLSNSYLNSLDITINGNAGFTGGLFYGGANLSLGNNSAQALIPRHLNPNVIVTMNGGAFVHTGQALSGGAVGGVVVEDVKTLRVREGNSNLTVFPRATSSSSRLQIASFERTAGATLQIRATEMNLATSGSAVVTVGDINTHLVGAGGLVTSATASIVPWMIGGSNISNEPDNFVGYDATNGLKILTTYQTNLASASAAENVALGGGVTLAGSKAINSLKIGTGAAVNLGTNILTVNSGAILFTLSGSITNGTLNFGAREGVVFVNTANNANNAAISATIAGSGGLTKGGTGILTLLGANSYTGTTSVSGGVLRAGATNVLNGTDVFLANTNVNSLNSPSPNVVTTLDLNNFGQTIGTLSGGGSFGGNVSLGSGTLTATGTSTGVYSGSIGGTGAFVKNGTGTQTLAGASGYSGGTTISLGTLLVNNKMGSATGSGAVLVTASGSASYGVLGGGSTAENGGTAGVIAGSGASLATFAADTTGIISGSVTLNQYARLAPGNSVGTLTVGALSLEDGSILDYEFSGTTNDFTAVSGLLNLESGGTIGINLYEVGTLNAFEEVGLYNLFSYGSLTGFDTSDFVVLNPGGGYSYTFVNDVANSLVQLDVSVVPEPSTVALAGLGFAFLLSRVRRSSRAA